MSQSLTQSFSQQMRMEQRLTPQLIQSMMVLQKPVTELDAFINDALETNAALELADPEAPVDHENSTTNGKSAVPTTAEDGFARLANFSRANGLDYDDAGQTGIRRRSSDGEPDAKMGAMANAPGREANLHEHLTQQWIMAEVDPEIRRAGETIINQLDLDGYLRVPLEEVARRVRPRVDSATMQGALKAVQQLDPIGVAARDVVECLLLQLETLPGDNHIERVLIQNHLDDLVHNRLPAISKVTNFSVGEIQEAVRAMRSTLHLHPGYLVGDRSVPGIRPDVIVDYAETGNGLTLQLARGNAPKLRINEEVAAMARSRNDPQEVREFARKQVELASAIIDAVQFRQNRLIEISKAIVERQREFFDVGPEALKVCRMSDMAVDLGCDPSTISRTVADKYMQTPRGIYPMRYFFSGGVESEDGETVGWDHVKRRVREIVDGENKRNPLNDDQIADALKREGIVLSRRTIAKYRTQLDIPTGRQRREY